MNSYNSTVSFRGTAVKSIIALSVFLVLVFSFAASAAQVNLMQGEVRKGAVSMLDKDGLRYAALDEMLSALGLAPTPAKGGLIVTFSGKKIEFWSGSSVARVNGIVMSLPSVVFTQDGHWWGERESCLQAISQFLSSASRPSDISWADSSKAARPGKTPIAPQPPANIMKQADSSKTASGGARIDKLRWGEQDRAYRAVIDVSREVEVKLGRSGNTLEVTFKGTSSPAINETSPWPGLSVVSRQSSGDTVFIFKHSAEKVSTFWVDSPPRYVVDFYTSSPAPAVVDQVIITRAPSASTGSVPPAAGRKKHLIVVDAGHGGHDPGAVGNKLREKDINLKAAGELSAILKRMGYDVRLTRADDRYLKLNERTVIANEANADIFISLHCNALPKGKHATGIELYLMAESTDKDALNLAILENRELSGSAQNAAEVNAAADKRTQLLLKILGDMQQNDKINESTVLAEHIHDRMKSSGHSIRKVRQAPFFVLKGAGMPSLLVEMGYISEASDAKLLNSEAYRKKMLEALATGIAGYLKRGS